MAAHGDESNNDKDPAFIRKLRAKHSDVDEKRRGLNSNTTRPSDKQGVDNSNINVQL